MTAEYAARRSSEALGQDLHERLERFQDTLRVWEELVGALNGATVDDLQHISGFGPVLAERVTSHRDHNGPFDSVEDLLDIEGIGAKRLAALREAVADNGARPSRNGETRYQRQTAHLPRIGESTREFITAAARLRVDRGRRAGRSYLQRSNRIVEEPGAEAPDRLRGGTLSRLGRSLKKGAARKDRAGTHTDGVVSP